MNTSGLSGDTRRLIEAHRSAVVAPRTIEKSGQGSGTSASGSVQQSSEFSKLFESKVKELKFSAHAATRIKSRNIELTPEVMDKLEKAVDGAAQKGSRDSLILLKNSAFIVNIPNRTVVTAMDGAGLRDNIFTNIDSAVVVD